MKSGLAYAIALILIVLTATQPAAAQPNGISIPFMTTDLATYTCPNAFTSVTITEFNSINRADASAETLDVDFPLFSEGIGAGPAKGPISLQAGGVTLGAGSSSNVLPFGLVDLTLPSISQTANERSAYQRTHFFSDTTL